MELKCVLRIAHSVLCKFLLIVPLLLLTVKAVNIDVVIAVVVAVAELVVIATLSYQLSPPPDDRDRVKLSRE